MFLLFVTFALPFFISAAAVTMMRAVIGARPTAAVVAMAIIILTPGVSVVIVT